MRLFKRSKTVHLTADDMLQNNNTTKKNADFENSKYSFQLLDSVPEVKEIKLSESSHSCFSRSQTSVSSVKKTRKNPDLIKNLLSGKHKVYGKVMSNQKRIPYYRIFDFGKHN